MNFASEKWLKYIYIYNLQRYFILNSIHSVLVSVVHRLKKHILHHLYFMSVFFCCLIYLLHNFIWVRWIMMLVKYNGFLSCILSKIADPQQGTKFQNIGKSAKYTFCPLAALPRLETCHHHKFQVWWERATTYV